MSEATRLILASNSRARADMLRAAGLTLEIAPPRMDEEAAKASLRAAGLGVRDQADQLAELKALSVSRRTSGLVIGADQMLSLEGRIFDKPKNLAEARAQLEALRGATHELVTAAVIACDGAPIWRRVETPRLRMRRFSDSFLHSYLEQAGEAALASVGAYQIEGLGAQLFDAVEGDYFSILGLPLLPLLAFLREHGILSQ